MELSWLMKSRIGAAAVVGVVLIGLLAWPLARPDSPFGAVRSGSVGYVGAVILVLLAFATGLAGYFVSWPHGREIGILAVPFGLSVWGIRSGSMGGLMQLNPTFAQRQAIFAGLRWEPIFWLVLIAAGFAGVILGGRIRSKAGLSHADEAKAAGSKSAGYMTAAIALIGSALISQFCLKVFVRDIAIHDGRLGSVAGQPATGQVAFGVLVSFGVAAFLVKTFLDVDYKWPIMSAALVSAFSISIYVTKGVLEYLCTDVPAVFFPSTVISVLPVQMVAFGTLGAVAGYWFGVRYRYWRKHEAR